MNMRKILRNFFWIIKGTLLLACMGSVFLWWHGYRAYDRCPECGGATSISVPPSQVTHPSPNMHGNSDPHFRV